MKAATPPVWWTMVEPAKSWLVSSPFGRQRTGVLMRATATEIMATTTGVA
jgi:hypothetical protein